MNKTLFVLLVCGSAWATTPGLVGNSIVHHDGENLAFRLTWAAAREVYDYLTGVPETQEGVLTLRPGRDITCSKLGDLYECLFLVKKTGEIDELVVSPHGEPAAKAFFSIWPMKDVLKVKLTSSVARLIVANEIGNEEIRCGKYAARFGRAGALTGRAVRCFVGFTPAGESVAAETIPH